MMLLGRLGTHGLAIVVVGAALVGASFSRPADALQSADAELTTAASDMATPTRMSLDLLGRCPPPVADGRGGHGRATVRYARL